MTTIAFDGKTLAADGQVTMGDSAIASLTRQKLFKNVGMFQALAFCGSLDYVESFLEWAEHPEGSAPPEGEYTVIFVIDGEVNYSWMMSPITEYVKCDKGEIDAWGSGAVFAIGAMRAGKTAREAVNLACTYDAFTGGKVRSMKVVK